MEELQIQHPADWMVRNEDCAIQLSLKPGKPIPMGKRESYIGTSPGCLFLTFVPSKGGRGYDWDRKISKTLKDTLVAELLMWLEDVENVPGDHELFLDDLTLIAASKRTDYSCQITASNDSSTIGPVECTSGNIAAMKILLQAALPKILGW